MASSPSIHHQQHYQVPAQICNSHCNIHPYNQSLPSNLPPPPNIAQQNAYYNHYNQPCSVHMQNYVQPASANNYYHLPHSKSLDQYDGKVQGNGSINPHHRLSLDQNYKMAQQLHQQHLSPTQHPQQLAQNFDHIDAAYNHPYNQPNSRAPLPYNISSNLGHTIASTSGHENSSYYPNDPINHSRMFSTSEFYQQQLMQLPTPVSDFHHQQTQQQPHQSSYHHHQKYSDTSSPAIQDELISFSNEPTRVGNKPEVKLRSSLKKTTHSTSDSIDIEQDLNDLRAYKREKSLTPASTSGDVKARDGIGNYQAWDYVFQNLEKDPDKKVNKMSLTEERIAAELESLKIKSNGHGPPRDRSMSSSTREHKSNSRASHTGTSVQTKARTKSVSTTTESVSNHEHKRTSSMIESNQRIQMPTPPELIVGPNEWSCRFCTFLNPNTKKICEMCSKSKDFFLDADKNNSNAATCV